MGDNPLIQTFLKRRSTCWTGCGLFIRVPLPLCVDPRLVEAYDLMQSKLVLQLGLFCSHPNPDSRPSMRFVRQVLSGDISLPSRPASKPKFSYTWKNTGLITGGGVGGVLPIRESTSMVGYEPTSSLDSQDQRLVDVSI